jgi:peptide/nickel transport system permease protein
MPVFWLAVLRTAASASTRRSAPIFFTVGEATPNLSGGVLAHWSDQLGHLLLRALTLILISVAGWSRYQQATMLDILHADYVRTARAKV